MLELGQMAMKNVQGHVLCRVDVKFELGAQYTPQVNAGPAHQGPG